jgi:hypothetical protein
MVAEEIVRSIAVAGGVLSLNGDKVKYRLPLTVAHLADELREHKPEIVSLLRSVGGRVAYFPACPKCGAYCLYRVGNAGLFECERCSLQGIEEHAARIASFLAESRSPGRVA